MLELKTKEVLVLVPCDEKQKKILHNNFDSEYHFIFQDEYTPEHFMMVRENYIRNAEIIIGANYGPADMKDSITISVIATCFKENVAADAAPGHFRRVGRRRHFAVPLHRHDDFLPRDRPGEHCADQAVLEADRQTVAGLPSGQRKRLGFVYLHAENADHHQSARSGEARGFRI